jgi:hypothetical protein
MVHVLYCVLPRKKLPLDFLLGTESYASPFRISGKSPLITLKELPSTMLLPALLLPVIRLLREQVHDILQRRVMRNHNERVLSGIELNHLSHGVHNVGGVAVPGVHIRLVKGLVPRVMEMDLVYDLLARERGAGLEGRLGVGRRSEDFGKMDPWRWAEGASVVAAVGSKEDEGVWGGTSESVQVSDSMLSSSQSSCEIMTF